MTGGGGTTGGTEQQGFPLRLGEEPAFRRVAEALRDASFDEATICRVLKIDSFGRLGTVEREQIDLAAAPTATLACWIRLLLLGEPVPHPAVAGTVEGDTLDAFLALDLLRAGPAAGNGTALYAPVMLYPVGDLLIASDRHDNPDGTPFVAPADAVFPAIFPGTLRFLQLLPQAPTGDALDLCAGSGVGALVLSRSAERAVAADITARSTHFARFNCRLNQRRNVEIAQGDLYQAVAGRTFDRIVAHPPYVPAVADTQIYRDAGHTGEAILQRIIAGLPQVLRPGGAFFSVCAAWDGKGGLFETRLRGWLGAAHAEFDVLFALEYGKSAADVAQELATRAGGEGPREPACWRQLFGDAGVERSVYGALLVDRPIRSPGATPRPPITRRLRLGARSDGASFAWLLRWLRWRNATEARGDLATALLQSTPRLSPHFRASVSHVPDREGGGLVVGDVVLEADAPFAARTRIDPWILPLIASFTGATNAAAVYQRARAAHEMPEAFGTSDFAGLLAMLIERGYAEASDLAFDR